MMKILTIFTFLFLTIRAFSCECVYSPDKGNIDSFENIFLAYIENDTARVIKVWKGYSNSDSSAVHKVLDLKCRFLYKSQENGHAYIYFINSTQENLCNTFVEYYGYTEVDYLEENYSALVKEKFQKIVDSIEYERKFIVKAHEPIDIKGKEVIFFKKKDYVWGIYRITIEKLKDIRQNDGFQYNHFTLIEEDFQSDGCHFDYVLFVQRAHIPRRITNRMKRIISRKARNACS